MFTLKIECPLNVNSEIKKNILFLIHDKNYIQCLILKDVFITILKIEQKIYIICSSKNKNLLNTQNNLIKQSFLGLFQGFKLKLNLIGIGYRYFINENKLYFKINKSHLIFFKIPSIIQIYQINSTTLLLKSINLQILTTFSAYLKKIIKPNIYKKKGIFFSNEIYNLKKKK